MLCVKNSVMRELREEILSGEIDKLKLVHPTTMMKGLGWGG